MDEIQPKYKPGDKVKFSPQERRKYDTWELTFKGCLGIVKDFSDLPIVVMQEGRYMSQNIICAHQEDLVGV